MRIAKFLFGTPIFLIIFIVLFMAFFSLGEAIGYWMNPDARIDVVMR